MENVLSKRKGIGSHQSSNMGKDEWITPPEIIKKLGHFDLDPCSPKYPPFKIAENHFYKIQNEGTDGLKEKWEGSVFCNPPYGLQAAKWLNKCAYHENAIALIFARTETKMFFNEVWNKAHSILFIEGRLYFHHVDGSRARSNAGAPSVLIAYNNRTNIILKESGIRGKLIELK